MMKFNEERHIYTNDEGIVYIGTTSFIKKFCKPFDKEKIAKKFAKKHKRTLEDVIEEWEKSGQEAIAKGTLYHKMRESELLGQNHISIDDIDHPIYPGTYEGTDKIIDSLKLEPGVYPELIVWSDRYQIAGQADYVEITASGKINIKDYKTSKEIKQRSYQRWDGTYETMGFPFTHLEDCNFNQYALQLNLYAYLIKSHNRNLKIGKLSIEHVIGDCEEGVFDIKEIIEHEVPNMQNDIKVGLEYYINRMKDGN